MIGKPQVVLRIGSHAEKEYFEKLAKELDGIFFGANLLEITPAATSTLLFNLRTKRGDKSLPFYLDPMTYAFGPYIDSKSGKKRTDMDALKSEQLEKRGSKKKVRRIKKSYRSLGKELGGSFQSAIDESIAVDPSILDEKSRDAMCKSVVDYQLNRIPGILQGDPFMADLADGVSPAAVFAPYFYIDKKWWEDGLRTAFDLTKRTVAIEKNVPIHVVLCVDRALLQSKSALDKIKKELPTTGAHGVWLWFNGFDELNASVDDLVAFRKLIQQLSDSMQVFNRHGGYFSLLLAHDGLSGISHGVGYGERKEVAQVIGATAPTVRYYLPAITKRVGVPDVQRCFVDVGIDTPQDFFDKVCDCQICKGIIGSDISRFASFGEMHRATSISARDTQTPAAAKMCRYHFLISRFKEKVAVSKLVANERAQHVADKAKDWRDQPSLRPHFEQVKENGYPERWAKALS